MTATKVSPERAYAEHLRELSDDDLHDTGFRLVRAMRDGDEGGRLTPMRRLELLDAELARRDLTREISTGSER